MSENINPEAPVQTVPKKQKKKWPWIVGIIAFIIVIASCAGNAGSKSDSTESATPPAVTQEAPPQVVPAPEAPKQDEGTVSQKNALKKAESYLSFMGFSESGLVKQLEFDKFTAEDAAWAVAHVKVDWNEQAVKKAKSYLNTSAFSHEGLVQQLQFEGFTPEQAEHGVTGAGL